MCIDSPSKHPNYLLPIVDTEHLLKTKNDNALLVLSHYTKPMASKYPVHNNAAIAVNAKLNILIVELVRVMRKVSRICDPMELWNIHATQIFRNKGQD